MSSITFNCANCGKAYICGAQFAGKGMKCKQCGQVNKVPGLAAKTVAQYGSSLYDLDEPAPLPQRGGMAPSRPMQPPKFFDDEAPRPQSGLKRGLSIAGGVVGFLVVFGIVTAAIKSGRNNPNELNNDANAQANLPPSPEQQGPIGGTNSGSFGYEESAGPIAEPLFTETGPLTEIQPGITFQEIRLQPSQPLNAGRPGQRGRLWIYMPTRVHQPGSLPCVFITGAGSNLITGASVGEDSRPEHIPYVQAGFAVVAYELDGDVPDLSKASEQQILQASRQFLAAQAGLVNAKIALDYALKHLPQVDPERIYAAGHSSAGTMALLFASSEPRVKGCAAYAPVYDMNARFDATKRTMISRVVPSGARFFNELNPANLSQGLNGPVFLFQALDDTNVVPAMNDNAANQLRSKGKKVTYVKVTNGGHYQSMISDGIPRAIEWLKGLPASADNSGGVFTNGSPAQPRNQNQANRPNMRTGPPGIPVGPRFGPGSRTNPPGRNMPGMRKGPMGPRGPGFNNRPR